MKTVPIDRDRLWGYIENLEQRTERDRPYTRRAFTPQFDEGRSYLVEAMRDAGLTVRVDTVGNLIGRLAGETSDAPTIAIGSHSDTVRDGGRFDGIAGVAAALEVVRAYREAGLPRRYALEVIDFLAEEPTDFGIACIGSRGIAGALTDDMLQRVDYDGRTLADAIDSVGGDVARRNEARRSDIVTFLELHIEQGRVLESAGRDIGIVTAFAGIDRIEITYEGRADHAGTTPMSLRHDASLPAAATVIDVERIAREIAESRGTHFVATCGIVEVQPNAANVVPRTSRIVIDVRSSDTNLLSEFGDRIDELSMQHAKAAEVERTAFSVVHDSPVTRCAPSLVDRLETVADELGFTAERLVSGAGHDAVFMTTVAPTAIVFVPCRGGISHAPAEWTEPDQLAAGTEVLMETVRRLQMV